MAVTVASCMGGWCAKREACARYLQPGRGLPIERLCEPGRTDAFEAVPFVVEMLLRLQMTPDAPSRGAP
jgi:hypothetical protein